MVYFVGVSRAEFAGPPLADHHSAEETAAFLGDVFDHRHMSHREVPFLQDVFGLARGNSVDLYPV